MKIIKKIDINPFIFDKDTYPVQKPPIKAAITLKVKERIPMWKIRT